jgi:hypothetical protein
MDSKIARRLSIFVFLSLPLVAQVLGGKATLGGSAVLKRANAGGWQFSRSLTIDHTKVPSDQTNFPVSFAGTYTYLKTVANGGKVTSSSGYDIGFATNSTCASLITTFELESYNASSGAVSLHVKLATISSTVDDVIYLCYGNTSITTNQSNALMWSGQFKGVYHLGDGTTLAATDSTSNAKNLTLTNTPTVATGQTDGAGSFNGSNQYATTASSLTSVGANFSMEAWLKPSSLNQIGMAFCNGDDNGGFCLGVGLSGGSTGGDLVGLLSSVGWVTCLYTFPNTTTWHHVAITYTFSTLSAGCYVDGTLINSNTTSAPATASAKTTIGGETIAGRYFAGAIDEVRMTNTVLTADWIAATFNSYGNPGTFYTLGSENTL